MKPLISILIPSFNSTSLIIETLDSIKEQVFLNWECIIVDDGSEDETLSVIGGYALEDQRFRCYVRDRNRLKGPSACRNIALEHARGKFVIFLDSDDLLSKECLQKRMEFCRENKNGDIWIFTMQSFIGTIDNRIFKYGYFNFNFNKNYCLEEFKKGYHPFVITCPIWRKKVLIELGGFNEKLNLQTDTELHLRALKREYNMIFANSKSADCYYRVYENNNSKNKINLKLENHYIVLNQHLDVNDKFTVSYFRRVFGEFIFNNLQIIHYYKFINLGIKKGVASNRTLIYGIIVFFYNITQLKKVKKIGYNTIKNRFNSSIISIDNEI